MHAAAVSHIPGRSWAKTVVCVADAEVILAVVPAHYTIELDRLRELAGAQALRLAQPREITDLYPDCEEGAMPPFGELYLQRVFVDESCSTRAPTPTVFGCTTVISRIWRVRPSAVSAARGTFSRRAEVQLSTSNSQLPIPKENVPRRAPWELGVGDWRLVAGSHHQPSTS
jgi:hypothetical protein